MGNGKIVTLVFIYYRKTIAIVKVIAHRGGKERFAIPFSICVDLNTFLFNPILKESPNQAFILSIRVSLAENVFLLEHLYPVRKSHNF